MAPEIPRITALADEGLSTEEIAAAIGMNRAQITRLARRYGVRRSRFDWASTAAPAARWRDLAKTLKRHTIQFHNLGHRKSAWRHATRPWRYPMR
jgi:Homeodomain-like domain